MSGGNFDEFWLIFYVYPVYIWSIWSNIHLVTLFLYNSFGFYKCYIYIYIYIKVLHHFLITYDSLPRATWKFVRFILTSGLTRWMREWEGILFNSVLEGRKSSIPGPLPDSFSTEMHRKTQWWQDKVKSQSCVHSVPCLPSDKAQLGIWFSSRFISALYFPPPTAADIVKFL